MVILISQGENVQKIPIVIKQKLNVKKKLCPWLFLVLLTDLDVYNCLNSFEMGYLSYNCYFQSVDLLIDWFEFYFLVRVLNISCITTFFSWLVIPLNVYHTNGYTSWTQTVVILSLVNGGTSIYLHKEYFIILSLRFQIYIILWLKIFLFTTFFWCWKKWLYMEI